MNNTIYNGDGDLTIALLYDELFNKICNSYVVPLEVNKVSLDIEKCTESFFVKLFNLCGNNYKIISNIYNEDVDISATGVFYTIAPCLQRNIDSTYFIIIDYAFELIYFVNGNRFIIYYSSNYSIKELSEISSKKLEQLPFKTIVPKEAEVRLIAYDGGFYSIPSKINSLNINIDKNYNDDFIPVYEDIKKFLDSRESGLAILSGLRGTGKTSIIRHLCSVMPKRYLIATNYVANRLAEPEFIVFLMNNKDSVIILEDCEQILIDRSKNSFGSAISTILNMSDGLLSDVFNIKFICTFNADSNTIDPALLRPGRCYANYEFKALKADKVKKLGEDLGLEFPNRDMTLAEIYHFQNTNYDIQEPKESRKIGF